MASAWNLVPINSESVPRPTPLPFALRSANGALLAQKVLW